jgi:phage tail-like protein
MLYEEMAFIALHFHWSHGELMRLEHRDRRRWCAEISAVNRARNGTRFLVEIEGIASAAFSRVKGLSREIKHESFREGGVNDYDHKLVSQVSYPPLVLERGLALTNLWQWTQDVANGQVVRRKVSIRLLTEGGIPAPGLAWHADSAFPVKWSCTDLDAFSSQVVMESVELAHHGLRRDA